MDSNDTDFRYMAANDLMNDLQKPDFTLDETNEKKVVQKVLKLMDDANGEVQNLAVKCLAPLVKKVRETQLAEIIDKLCEYATQKKEELRDIAGIGLKTVIVEIPSNSPNAGSVVQRLIPKLLSQLENVMQMDTLDILSELLARFGSSVGNNVTSQKRIQNVLVPLLSHSRPAFRKRTTIALGNLVTHAPDDLFNELVQKLLAEFERAQNQKDNLKTLIQCVGTLRDYSDDDDISWKVRRSSSKLLASIIGTRHELLSQLYNNVAPALVSRFKEREESVRVDILQTFIVLLRQTHVYGGEGYIPRENDHEPKRRRAIGPSESQESPKQMLRNLVQRLSRNLSKQLVSKSIITKQTGFLLLRELVTVLNGGLDNHLNTFIPAIESSLSTSSDTSHHHTSTNSNLKIETLSFLRQLFKVHPPQVFHKHLARLCPPIISSVQDSFYKITSEAFLVCIELIKVIRPIEYQENTQTYNVQPLNPEFRRFILDIYNVTIARLSTPDADQEVKERSIMCLGVLISQAGDNLQDELKACMPILLERLRNEVTRLTTVKTFTMIADSTVCESEYVKVAITDAIQEVASLLRKHHRQLKVAALVCLEVFVHPVNNDILPSIFQLVQSTLVQGAALDSLLVLFRTLIETDEDHFNKLLDGLLSPVQKNQDLNQLTLSKQSGENIEEGTRGVVAECLGKLTLANPNKFLPELQKRLRSDSAQTRGTVVTAIKFTFINQGQEYDELLRPLIVDFLSSIQDNELPYLIRDVLDQLLPLLYEETLIKMGPFKHKVDDEPLKGTLSNRIKENAVKSEIDKNNELCRSAVRAAVVLNKLAEQDTKIGSWSDQFNIYQNELENKESAWTHPNLFQGKS
ncbi:10983_t:CDS:10 [Racocetra fulgida]|uniref:10983_t:CDS:1 n=1 Tax=Racocetra fulgida TaxID=60492 RepID=A0A9N9ARG9_9GLOM|nr:10983_t:CDS:10 [Racocetra fulgida]